MSKKSKTVTIDGVEYVPLSEVEPQAQKLDGMEYVIIRTYSAGVHAGYLKNRNGKEVELINARRLWYWSGAASLSELAVKGVKNPSDCKFPCEVSTIVLTEAIEVIQCTEVARLSIKDVSEWEA